MFEKATRFKLRFEHKGVCSVEDLWDLDVHELDAIFKKLNARLREQQEESLLDASTRSDEVLALKVDVVRRIVEVKVAEAKARKEAAAKAAEKEKLLRIISYKQDAALMDAPIEELEKMVESI